MFVEEAVSYIGERDNKYHTIPIPHPYQHLEDIIMAHRYLYYIEFNPIIPDHEFDVLERNARSLLKDKEDSPVHLNGSELADSYSTEIKLMALKWMNQ